MAATQQAFHDHDATEPQIHGRLGHRHQAFRRLRASFVPGLKHLPIRLGLRCG